MQKFDDSLFDVIVFDEIFNCDLLILRRIYEYSLKNPHKIILATGDSDQNRPVELWSTEIDHKEYSYHCISVIFQNQILLKQNKRLKNKEDIAMLDNIKKDILNPKISVSKTVAKYFTLTDKPSENNIAYRNEVADDVSRTRRSLLNKDQPYEIGEKLLCKKFYKTIGSKKMKDGSDKKTEHRCNKNCSYTITDINPDSITIKDTCNRVVLSDELQYLQEEITEIKQKNNYTLYSYDVYIKIPISKIKQHFTYAYCRTGHSIQGITIDTAITIYDHNFYYTSREWLWTAITRATDFKQVYFYNGKSQEFNRERLLSYFRNKIAGYVDQDTKAKRKYDKTKYITVEWLEDAFSKTCYRCSCVFDAHISQSVRCNLTADRQICENAHTIDNIVPCCVECNTSASDNLEH